jgi:phage protein D
MGALSSIPARKEDPVPTIGDGVRFESTKVGQVPRDGVVTGVDGELLHIEWSTGGESSLVPGAGSITIVGKVSGKSAAKRTIKKRAARKAAKKSTPAKRRTPARKAAKKSAPAKKRTPARKAAKKAVKKRAPARKRPAKRAAKR